MALTLSAGISASDRYCTVNQPPTQPPGSYYRIGDEVVQHIGYPTTTPIWTPNLTQLYIARAQLGTTAASHLSAAALTYVRPEFLSATAETDPGPFETGGGGGGGGLVMTLIGPFRVNYNDAGIDGDGVAVATLEAGTLVLKGWLVVLDPFIAGGSEAGHQGVVTVGVAAITNYETNFGTSGFNGHEAHSDTPVTHNSKFVSAGGQPLAVAIYPASGSFTAGAADCYAVIATPAV